MTREEVAKRIDRLWPCAADRVVQYFEHVYGIELDEPVEQWEGINGVNWRILSRPGEGLVIECNARHGDIESWYQPEDEVKIQELMRQKIMKLDRPISPAAFAGVSASMRGAGDPVTKSGAACTCWARAHAKCSNCAEPETFDGR